MVVPGAKHHAVQRALVRESKRSSLHRRCIRHVQGERPRAGVGIDKGVERVYAPRRHDHFGTLCVQRRCAGTANAGGGAYQPNGAAAPIGHAGVQSHIYLL